MLLRLKMYDRVKFGVIILFRTCEYECLATFFRQKRPSLESPDPKDLVQLASFYRSSFKCLSGVSCVSDRRLRPPGALI